MALKCPGVWTSACIQCCTPISFLSPPMKLGGDMGMVSVCPSIRLGFPTIILFLPTKLISHHTSFDNVLPFLQGSVWVAGIKFVSLHSIPELSLKVAMSQDCPNVPCCHPCYRITIPHRADFLHWTKRCMEIDRGQKAWCLILSYDIRNAFCLFLS